MLNNWISMIFVYVAVSVPFSVYLLVGYLRSVPRSLDEAAIMDGCQLFPGRLADHLSDHVPGIVATATYASCCAGRSTFSRSRS